jgi:hypothetical protein
LASLAREASIACVNAFFSRLIREILCRLSERPHQEGNVLLSGHGSVRSGGDRVPFPNGDAS